MMKEASDERDINDFREVTNAQDIISKGLTD